MLGHSIKTMLAAALSKTALSDALIVGQRRLRGNAFVRAVNYHGTIPAHAQQLERQLAFLAKHFRGVGLTELLALLESGEWPHAKPGLLVTFDDGLRTNFDVARPLLEKYGFTGWFFVPVGFADCAASEQQQYANTHDIRSGFSYDDGRVCMSWSELKELSARHEVGCHTMQHRRMPASVAPADMRHEIIDAKRVMESRMGREIPTFCWVGGEEENYSALAASLIREAGFRVAFMTSSGVTARGCNPLQIQRTNIEADWPVDVVKFQLCGAMDLLHRTRRTRVNRLTAG
jgi:peptidoglycan/xylan/chitin deacetylase (PgdA/CDA1 family)